MIYGKLPFSSENERDLVKMIKCDNVRFPKSVPITPQGKDVIKRMLDKESKKRLELIEFVQMDYAIMDEEEFDIINKKAQDECI